MMNVSRDLKGEPIKMKRLSVSPDNPVRRRLFPPAEDAGEEARIDNLANILQEESARDRIEKMEKWNFDFVNERPLDGLYQWERCDNDPNNFIGTKAMENLELDDEIESETMHESDSLLDLQKCNETTPDKSKNKNEDENEPLIKRRRSSQEGAIEKCVRRAIPF